MRGERSETTTGTDDRTTDDRTTDDRSDVRTPDEDNRLLTRGTEKAEMAGTDGTGVASVTLMVSVHRKGAGASL